jgi:hypothetical protein
MQKPEPSTNLGKRRLPLFYIERGEKKGRASTHSNEPAQAPQLKCQESNKEIRGSQLAINQRQSVDIKSCNDSTLDITDATSQVPHLSDVQKKLDDNKRHMAEVQEKILELRNLLTANKVALPAD